MVLLFQNWATINFKKISFQSPLEPEFSRSKGGVEVLVQEHRISRKQDAIWQGRYQKKPCPSMISDFAARNCALVPSPPPPPQRE